MIITPEPSYTNMDYSPITLRPAVVGTRTLYKSLHRAVRSTERTLRAFFQVRRDAAEQGFFWRPALLRTTSQLERENRNLRARLRKAVVFHSADGLSAMLYQNLSLRTAARSPDTASNWIRSLERQIRPASNFLT